MYDLKHITDFIFKNKNEYNKLSDEDKEKFFFIINRKFARQYPYHAQVFNKEGIDKSTAMDIWYYFFIKKRVINTPKWYWFKLSGINKLKTNIKYKNEEIEFVKNFYDIDDYSVEYLMNNYSNEFDIEIKKYRKFIKNGKT